MLPMKCCKRVDKLTFSPPAAAGDAKLTELLQTLADRPKVRVAGVRDGCKAAYAGALRPRATSEQPA
jgi:hypothetical protein